MDDLALVQLLEPLQHVADAHARLGGVHRARVQPLAERQLRGLEDHLGTLVANHLRAVGSTHGWSGYRAHPQRALLLCGQKPEMCG